MHAGGADIHHSCQHDLLGFVQSQLFLKLQWRHARDIFEVGVKRRHTHIAERGQFLHFHRFFKMFADPADGFGYSLQTGIGGRNLCHQGTDITTQQSDEDFIDNQWLQKLGIFRLCQQLKQTSAGFDNLRISLTDKQSSWMLHPGHSVGESFKVSSASFCGSISTIRHR